MKFRKILLTVATFMTLCLALPVAGHAQWHRDSAVIAVPGLTIGLNDNDFAYRWNHVDGGERGRFCYDVRRDCDYGGRYSRACHLKWQYCAPHHRDYGYYYNR